MGKFLRLRTFLFAQPSKPLSFSSLSSHYTDYNCSLSANITNKAFSLINSCKSLIHLSQIQSYLITSGLFQDPSFSGRLLKISWNLSNDLRHTLLIFRCIDFPDAFCVNTVMKSYCCRNFYREAVVFYVEMLRDCDFCPNSFTFPPLISACAKLRCLGVGQMCHGHAVKFGVDSVLPVENALIHLYACCGVIDVAGKVFVEMLVRDLVSWNTIIDGYAKAGEMGLAHKLFDLMPDRNVVSWNVMMTGYLNYRNPGNVLKLFREMMTVGFKSNDTTMVNVVTACGRSNNLREGKSVHGVLVKTFFGLSLIVSSTIVDMYGKCGRVDLARLIFNRMQIRNLVSWNTMILGHCIHGDPIDGLSLYHKMVDESSQKDESNTVSPDEVTFIGVLCACARKGMLAEAKSYISEMINEFYLKPHFAHYWCMANLMANVGLVQEAVDILKNIPFDDDISLESSIWAGLFGSCRFEGDVAFGEQIANKLIEQDPWNFSYYNLLVNIYAAGGRWEDVSRTKDVMKERGIKRVPCCGLKDLTEIVCNDEV